METTIEKWKKLTTFISINLFQRGKEQNNKRFSAPKPTDFQPFLPTFPRISKKTKMAAATLMPHVDMDAAPTLALQFDPFFLAMESGKIQWGDLMAGDRLMAVGAKTDEYDDRIVEWWTDEYKTAERLADFEVPDLTLRDHIVEHFPVVLQALPASDDGRERFVIKFDDRVDEWADAYAESNDEHAEYADWVQTRLVFALRQYSHKYRIESAGGADHVAIFAMAHPSAAARRARAAIPTLRGFPVSWDRDPADHSRHLIKLHTKRVTDECWDLDKMANDIVDALVECKDCTIAPAADGSTYLMVVTIPTAEAPAAAAPRPVAAAPRPAPAPVAAAPAPAMGGAGGPSRSRALDVMRANRLAWDRDRRDSRVHRIKHRSRDQEPRILAELARCCDCSVDPTPRDPEYMCVLTLH
jgi:hypothetical protein